MKGHPETAWGAGGVGGAAEAEPRSVLYPQTSLSTAGASFLMLAVTPSLT